jgi:hypothetical protein
MVHRHSICFRYFSGQIGTVELNEKVLISRSKTEMLEQSGADQNNGNKNRKRCNIIAGSRVGWSHQRAAEGSRKGRKGNIITVCL